MTDSTFTNYSSSDTCFAKPPLSQPFLKVQTAKELCQNAFLYHPSGGTFFDEQYFIKRLADLNDQERFKAFETAFLHQHIFGKEIVDQPNQIFNGLPQDWKQGIFGANIQGNKSGLFFNLNIENQQGVQAAFLASLSPQDRQAALEKILKNNINPHNQFAPLFVSGRPFEAFTPAGAKAFFKSVTDPNFAESTHTFSFQLDPTSEAIQSFNAQGKCTEQKVLAQQCFFPQLASTKIDCETKATPGLLYSAGEDTYCDMTLTSKEGAQATRRYTLPSDTEALNALIQQNFPKLSFNPAFSNASQIALQYALNQQGVHFIEKFEGNTIKPSYVKEAAHQVFDPLEVSQQPCLSKETLEAFAPKMEFSTNCNRKIQNGTEIGDTFCQFEMKSTGDEIVPWHQRVWQTIGNLKKSEVYISASSPATVSNYRQLFNFIGVPFTNRTVEGGKEFLQLATPVNQSSTEQPSLDINDYLNKFNNITLNIFVPAGAGILLALHSAKFAHRAAHKDSISAGRRIAGVFVGAVGTLTGLGVAYERLSRLQGYMQPA